MINIMIKNCFILSASAELYRDNIQGGSPHWQAPQQNLKVYSNH